MQIENILTEWLIHRGNGNQLRGLLNDNSNCIYHGHLFRAYRLEIGEIEGIMQEYADFQNVLSNIEINELQDGRTILLSNDAKENLIRSYIIVEDNEWVSYSKSINGCKKFIEEHAEQNSFKKLPVVYTKSKQIITGIDIAKLGEKYAVNQNLIDEYIKLEEIYGQSTSIYDIIEFPEISVYLQDGILHVEK
ncbi:hypothetical protein JJQ72_16860 [Paenibacillus sp. F411]|uniref:hypothetical protein n=1 Tax=Paenibacillus sp. F411 TaxID=2820239 RepID=UPI001AAFA134|nr:hypothetical protein [Paenibacillus sp. F411]MBO2945650.1 hypothetical protein [Paenibacillus sp. F411]